MTTATAAVHDLVHALVERIRAGDILGAFDAYYADDVVMQENTQPPTAGKAANRLREEAFLAGVKEWRRLTIDAVAADEASGTSFIEYGFVFVNQDGDEVTYQQVARQRWRNGRIVHERFYYGA